MPTRSTEVAVIGAGTAGLNARREAEKAGKDWLLIEDGPYGTTCARVGCMPSKLLIAAADSAHAVEEADVFGIDVEEGCWQIDGGKVMDRVQRERDRFAGFVKESTRELPADRRIRETASFVGPTTLKAGETTIDAETVVIATGSSPWIPPVFEDVRDEVITSNEVFELDTLPASIAVIGTGVIGLELGQAFDRLGAQVQFFNPFDEIGIFSDPMVDEKTREVFGDSLALNLETEVDAARSVEEGIRLEWEADGDTNEMVFDEVLVTAGRRPNLERLQIAEAGLKLDDSGVPVHDPCTMQCGDSPVFIAGDVCGHQPVLHEASDEGRIAGANAAAYPDMTASQRRESLTIVFTEPQMAKVGASYAELQERFKEVPTGEVSYDNQGRARVMNRNAGHVRLYANPETCRFLGAEMLGPDVEHTAHLLSWAAQQRMPVQQMLKMPFYHPVVEEGIRTALRDLAEHLRVVGHCPPEDFASSAGQ